jgi:hypothetical protein
MSKILFATDTPESLDKCEAVRGIYIMGIQEIAKDDSFKALKIVEYLGAAKTELAKILNVARVELAYVSLNEEFDESLWIPIGFVDAHSEFNPEDLVEFMVEQFMDFHERAATIIQARKEKAEMVAKEKELGQEV